MWRSQSDIHRHREAEVGRASVALCSRTFRRESDCSSLLVSSVVSDVQEVIQEQGRFGSPRVQTRRLNAAGNVSLPPLGGLTAALQQDRTGHFIHFYSEL